MPRKRPREGSSQGWFLDLPPELISAVYAFMDPLDGTDVAKFLWDTDPFFNESYYCARSAYVDWFGFDLPLEKWFPGLMDMIIDKVSPFNLSLMEAIEASSPRLVERALKSMHQNDPKFVLNISPFRMACELQLRTIPIMLLERMEVVWNPLQDLLNSILTGRSATSTTEVLELVCKHRRWDILECPFYKVHIDAGGSRKLLLAQLIKHVNDEEELIPLISTLLPLIKKPIYPITDLVQLSMEKGNYEVCKMLIKGRVILRNLQLDWLRRNSARADIIFALDEAASENPDDYHALVHPYTTMSFETLDQAVIIDLIEYRGWKYKKYMARNGMNPVTSDTARLVGILGLAGEISKQKNYKDRSVFLAKYGKFIVERKDMIPTIKFSESVYVYRDVQLLVDYIKSNVQ